MSVRVEADAEMELEVDSADEAEDGSPPADTAAAVSSIPPSSRNRLKDKNATRGEFGLCGPFYVTHSSAAERKKGKDKDKHRRGKRAKKQKERRHKDKTAEPAPVIGSVSVNGMLLLYHELISVRVCTATRR